MPTPDKAPQAAAPALRRLEFALAYALLFTSFSILYPYLQLLLRGLGYSQAFIGLSLGLFEIFGIAGPLLIARLVDARGHYRSALFYCSLVQALAMLPLVLFPGPLVTLLSLLFLAVGNKALVPLLDSAFFGAAAQAANSAARASDYGIVRAAGSVSFVAVALATQSIPGLAVSSPGRIALAVVLFTLLFMAGLTRMPNLSQPAARRAAIRPLQGAGYPMPARFWAGLAIIALSRLAIAPVNSFFSLYLEEELRWNAVGWMWALSAMAEVPAMLVAHRVINRIGPMRTLIISSLALAMRLAVYAVFPNPAGAVAGQLLHSLCYGIFLPAAIAFVNKYFQEGERTKGMALFSGIGIGLPNFAGASLGGLIAQAAGYRVLFAAFIPAALLSAFFFMLLERREPFVPKIRPQP